MADKSPVWEHRRGLEQRLSNVETHVENIYHHVKRIEHLVEMQNGRVRKNEEEIARWKGVVGVIMLIITIAATILH
jgi:hypothetical protein